MVSTIRKGIFAYIFLLTLFISPAIVVQAQTGPGAALSALTLDFYGIVKSGPNNVATRIDSGARVVSGDVVEYKARFSPSADPDEAERPVISYALDCGNTAGDSYSGVFVELGDTYATKNMPCTYTKKGDHQARLTFLEKDRTFIVSIYNPAKPGQFGGTGNILLYIFGAIIFIAIIIFATRKRDHDVENFSEESMPVGANNVEPSIEPKTKSNSKFPKS